MLTLLTLPMTISILKALWSGIQGVDLDRTPWENRKAADAL
jgi:hypothetical protein